ncbi:MAG: ribbon-helix-helix protein, CopG family [Gammaproteobacteria bacterium]|nr:MAG: ribbon-helix-helix protein, CopG family [Gammaproteobacteria bacterium]
MSRSTLISVRVSYDIAQRLANLADATERSKSYLVEQALEEFIALQEWQVKAIRHGIRQADAGKLVEHKRALNVLSRWRKRRLRHAR